MLFHRRGFCGSDRLFVTEGKKSGNGQMDRIFMNLNKELILTLSWGYIHVSYYYSQARLLVYISQQVANLPPDLRSWVSIYRSICHLVTSNIRKTCYVMFTLLHPIFILQNWDTQGYTYFSYFCSKT